MISEPSNIFLTSNPTCLHTVRVTFSLSPVKILVAIPYSFKARIAYAVDSFGGSKKARYPSNTISHSSFTPKVPTGDGLLFCAIPRTLNPLSFNSSTVFIIRLRSESVNS